MKDKFGGRVCSVKIKNVRIFDWWWSCQQKGKNENLKKNKRELKFEDYKNRLENNKIVLKAQKSFRSDAQNVCTEKVNKIDFSVTDNRRLQTSDGVTAYPCSYGC